MLDTSLVQLSFFLRTVLQEQLQSHTQFLAQERFLLALPDCMDVKLSNERHPIISYTAKPGCEDVVLAIAKNKTKTTQKYFLLKLGTFGLLSDCLFFSLRSRRLSDFRTHE